VAVFDKSLDSLSATLINSYNLNPAINILKAQPIDPLLNSVILQLASPLEQNIVYTLTVNNLNDCSNNQVGSYNHAKAGLATTINKKQILINEILFNPRPGGSDYVEIVNAGNTIADLSKINIAVRNSGGNLQSIIKLIDGVYYLYPGEYALFNSDLISLSLAYHVKKPDNCYTLSLPSLADDSGNLVLLNELGEAIDELHYSEDWHFPLLKDREGVSLERIDIKAATDNRNNWQSAASSAGFGTPGYVNSQQWPGLPSTSLVETFPKIFSPDLDGHDDYLLLQYQMASNGFMMNTIVFDAAGRMVRQLVKNTLLGIKGNFLWDGLNDKKEKLPSGSYIIYSELFNLEGKKQVFKNVVVLVR
jgi:hypothetical protein